MSDNLPINMDSQESGAISYANEVIAIIAGMAMAEVDGVAGHRSAGKSVTERIGLTKAANPVTKGVRVEVGSEEASVDLTLAVEYGKPIQKVCTEVQENVRKAIETMTGLHVVKVDVHVTNVIFEKDEQTAALAAKLEKVVEEKPAPKAEPVYNPDADEDIDVDTDIDVESDDEADEAPEYEPEEKEE